MQNERQFADAVVLFLYKSLHKIKHQVSFDWIKALRNKQYCNKPCSKHC